MIILYSLLVGAFFLLVWGISHLIAVFAGAPTVSAPGNVVQEAIKLARPKQGERFLDLGCGYGKTLAIAKSLGLKALGIDISPAAIAWNRVWRRDVRFRNLFDEEILKLIKQADIIYIYLLPRLVERLASRLANVKRGARIITISFPLEGYKPKQTKRLAKYTIYLYQP